MTALSEVSNRWPMKRLCEVFETQLGKMLSEKARRGVSPKPYLRNANVQWGMPDLSDVYVMDYSEREQQRFSLKSGDLLMCEGGEIGRTCLWREELSECYFQKAIHRLRPHSNDVEPEFYRYWMEWAFRYANVYGVTGTQTTIAHLPQEKLEQLSVPVPSISEQRAIAHVLRTVQKAREARQRELALERERKAALMEHLFTHGTRSEKTKQTDIGEIPESWSTVPLGTLARFRSGSSRPKDLNDVRTTEFCVPVYGGNGVMGFSSSHSSDRKLLVIGRVGAYCGCVHIADAPNWITDNALYADELSADVTLPFLAEQLRRRNLNQLKRKGAQPLVTQGILQGLQVVVPGLSEQNQIADVLAASDSKINALEKELRLHSELFASLLDVLMTGQVLTVQLPEELLTR